MWQTCIVLILQSFILLPLLTFSSQICNHHDKIALLQFMNEFNINPSSSHMYDDVGTSHPKTKSWNVTKDCCVWDGVICDTNSGHVVGLDLSCSQLTGIIRSNSSLFHLSRLKTLNLAYNSFYPSYISSNWANFSSLKLLNLSHTGFVGEVPIEFSRLSQLVSLDLTNPKLVGSDIDMFTMMGLPYSFEGLKFPHFDKITKNLTKLKQLHLNGVFVNSSIPQNIANLSYLTSLQLYNCSLQGKFPFKIMKIPHLVTLIIESNPNLRVYPSLFNNLSSSLKVVDFAYTNFSGRLVKYEHESQPLLTKFSVKGCNLFGTIPLWVWNTSEAILLDDNHFSGKLPSKIKAENLKFLKKLGLSDNLLKGIIPSWLFNLPSLIELELGGNQLSGVNSSSLYPSSKMQILNLSNNQLEGKNMLEFVAKYDKLETLIISHNHLSGQLPKTLASLSLLEYLDLSFNNLTGSFPPQLFRLVKNLRYFNVSENKLVGRIPPQFGDFSGSSFAGNEGLCGPPLSRPCRILNDHTNLTTTLSKQHDDDFYDIITRISLWKIVLIGFGFGIIVGFLAGGYMLYTLKTTLVFKNSL
ncbi:unnamed protein product [Amaranthus hypochondriacus]